MPFKIWAKEVTTVMTDLENMIDAGDTQRYPKNKRPWEMDLTLAR